MNNRTKALNDQRRVLRNQLIVKMKTNPTIEDSETLRLVENDISFWESQTDKSIQGLIKSLNESFKN